MLFPPDDRRGEPIGLLDRAERGGERGRGTRGAGRVVAEPLEPTETNAKRSSSTPLVKTDTNRDTREYIESGMDRLGESLLRACETICLRGNLTREESAC